MTNNNEFSSSITHSLQYDTSLAEYTTWKVGGRAEVIFTPETINDLQIFLKEYPLEKPIYFIGLGSNLLIRDKGVQGAIIITTKLTSKLAIDINKSILEVSCGVKCSKVARFSVKKNYDNLSFLVGIPGTIGGALAMNAGACGDEIWNFVQSVTTISRDANIYQRNKQNFDISYRKVIFQHQQEYFIKTDLKLNKSEQFDPLLLKYLLKKRNDSQPIGLATAGSTFKNPENLYAAKLIEDCGLKEYRLNGAKISDKHANFIINTGNATANDIEQLIEFTQQEVYKKHKVYLTPEVKIIGDKT